MKYGDVGLSANPLVGTTDGALFSSNLNSGGQGGLVLPVFSAPFAEPHHSTLIDPRKRVSANAT